MSKPKPNALEILWAIFGFLLFGMAIHQTWKEGFSESYIAFILSIVSFLMYIYRRNMRQKQQNQ